MNLYSFIWEKILKTSNKLLANIFTLNLVKKYPSFSLLNIFLLLSLSNCHYYAQKGEGPSLSPTNPPTPTPAPFTYGLKSFNIFCLSSLIPFIYIIFYSCICEKILKTPSKLLANILTLNLVKGHHCLFLFLNTFCHHFSLIASGSI